MLSAGEGNPVAAATSEIERMNLEIAKTEAIIAGSDAEMKSLEEQAKSMGITVKQYLTDLADMSITALGSGDALNELKRRANASGPEAEIAIRKSNAESELRDQEKRKKILEDQLTILKAQSDDVAKQKELRDKEIAANQKSLEDAKRRLESAQAELATQKALLEKRKEIEAAKLEANIKGNLEGFRMNPSDMLSSSGRIGGSVKEYSSAVATVNYQRETLKALKEIARNSRPGKVSTYY
jgi:chromosome segregation ATPase